MPNMIRKYKKFIAAFAVVALALFALVSCTNNTNTARNTFKNDRDATAQSLSKQQASQPTPVIPWSQFRQSVIEITLAKAKGTQTTSFFFLEGIGIVGGCASIGFPVPSTAQLTAPEAKYPSHDFTVPQAEPTGVYTGDSSGTYTICLNSDGKPYFNYWEGYVMSVTGTAKYTPGEGVRLTGDSTATISVGKEEANKVNAGN